MLNLVKDEASVLNGCVRLVATRVRRLLRPLAEPRTTGPRVILTGSPIGKFFVKKRFIGAGLYLQNNRSGCAKNNAMPIAAGNFRYYVCAHGAERDAVFDRSIRAESHYVYGALHYAEKLPFADPMPMWAHISPHYSGIQNPVSWISQFGVKIKVRSSARRGRSAG